MLLKSIKLHNIRSYEDEEINFPIGSVLLAGDIGSGKSTILLAIEFAIFGAKKGELPAYTLLKHGKKEGYVELKMQIDGKEILIKRTLKRSNEDIKQETGYVIVNGLKKEATSEELRAITLDLLGYPKELIKKGKDLIYRYTVYTPQEEMKQILYDTKENRLETLRKVFNIDKYKRVRENSKIITTSLREKKKHLEGFILDLDYKKKELEERKEEILEIDNRINNMLPKIEEVRNILTEKKNSLDSIESEIKELNILKKELGIAEANLSHKIEQNNRLNDEIKLLEKQIGQLGEELKDKKLDELDNIIKKIEEKENEINQAEKNYNGTIRGLREIEVRIENCNETIRKIESLEICPLCEQKVDESHKHEIHSRENKKYEELLEQVKNHKQEEANLEKIRMGLKKERDFLVKEQSHFNVIRYKFDSLNEKTSLREEKSNLKEKIRKEIGLLNAKKIELSEKIGNFSEVDERYKIAKKEIDEIAQQEKFLELEKRDYESKKSTTKMFISRIEKEIAEKEKAKGKLAYISQLSNWIDEMFVNLMSTMEKHVMVNIHSQFNELFRSWFDTLLEDESINIRVDEEFTPIIEQDGYETYIENLSGGEKTSVALSYRLALNKVINDIVAGIKTKEIIMLDEPTDGFSGEQLDKVRDVLNQLNMKQIIIVSHESKIESFVDNVIRVEKKDNVSVVST
ncbi:SMC family ATPase [Candidatus Woesearchaeota archaeon]|nr:SMC family ATPase [Candidatus Woesearchaeota archaeon]